MTPAARVIILSLLSFTVLILIDLAIEYGGFRANYFQHRADSWNTLAERWDRLQGEHGDDYRRAVLHPHVIAWIRDTGLACCVDLGCGNGCTARVIADTTRVAVLGVDAAPAMVDLANLYESRAERTVESNPPMSLSFLSAAIDDQPSLGVGTTASICDAATRLRAEHAAPLGVVSMFLPQDCARLDLLMACVSGLLHDGEPFLMVYESEAGFDPSAPHANTMRTWKYSFRRSGPTTQIMTWLPVQRTASSSLFSGQPDDPAPPINTVTFYRVLDDYLSTAAASDLTPVAYGDVLLAGTATTPAQLGYQHSPKFSYITFIKEAR
jgi:SAM-dependent methyltransferase